MRSQGPRRWLRLALASALIAAFGYGVWAQLPPQSDAQAQPVELPGGRDAAQSVHGSAPGEAERHANRLAAEASPYLQLHAHNPVDWYPWGEEAFARAKAEDKPIFLSVGYSTCYWCHVMEREVFSNPEIASLMNAHFVSIKVDREERPDVDAIYMQATHLLTGSGGWPNSVFLTPDGGPFYAAAKGPAAPSEFRLPRSEDHVRASLRAAARSSKLLVLLSIDEGWHLNANPATLPFLAPTEVELVDGAGAGSIQYPEGHEFRPAFSAETIRVYSESVEIPVLFAEGVNLPTRLALRFQACDESRCLPPGRAELAVGEASP